MSNYVDELIEAPPDVLNWLIMKISDIKRKDVTGKRKSLQVEPSFHVWIKNVMEMVKTVSGNNLTIGNTLSLLQSLWTKEDTETLIEIISRKEVQIAMQGSPKGLQALTQYQNYYIKEIYRVLGVAKLTDWFSHLTNDTTNEGTTKNYKTLLRMHREIGFNYRALEDLRELMEIWVTDESMQKSEFEMVEDLIHSYRVTSELKSIVLLEKRNAIEIEKENREELLRGLGVDVK